MDDNNGTTIHDTHIGDRSKINRLRDNTKQCKYINEAINNFKFVIQLHGQ